MNLETSQLSLSFKLFSKWADHLNPHKNNNIPALFASKYSRLRICEQLNKGKAQAAVPVICATKHLLLSRGLSGRPPALCSLINPRRVCIFRHDTPLDAFHQIVSSSIFVNSGKCSSLCNHCQISNLETLIFSLRNTFLLGDTCYHCNAVPEPRGANNLQVI